MSKMTVPLALRSALLIQLIFYSVEAFAFVSRQRHECRTFHPVPVPCRGALFMAQEENDVSNESSTEAEPPRVKEQGDSLRALTGIRPSLHPVTINALSEALRIRATPKENEPSSLDVSDASTQPLDVALNAGKIAALAIDQRNDSSKKAKDEDMILTHEEGGVVAGRVVGVVMRLPQLEETLFQKVQATPWVTKYGAHDTFGVLPSDSSDLVQDRIRDDPLFRMSRAESLLALFIHTVEQPTLAKMGEQVADNSKIDFMDADQLEVLLSS